MKVDIKAHTNGKSKWSTETLMVQIIKLDIGRSSLTYFPEDAFKGELRAYFESHGYTDGSWNVDGHGLIYGDKLWLKEFKQGLRDAGFSIKAAQNVKYNDIELQGYDYVSLEVGPMFYASWMRLNKISRQVVTEPA